MKGLGKRIKEIRKTKELTLVEMSKKTGMDIAVLSRIENGIMTGTLNSHMKIAEALGVNLPDLYQDVMDHVNAPKERAARQRIETFSHSSGAVAELLTTGILKKKMMPVLLKIKPKGHTEKEEHPPFSERFAYVLKGTMEIIFGKDKKTLVEGEGLYFDSSLPHTFKNLSSSECWCLSVVTPPSL